jgi:hypothetical protein
MKHIPAIILLTLGNLSVNAQDSTYYSKINLYGELGGPAAGLSGKVESSYPLPLLSNSYLNRCW